MRFCTSELKAQVIMSALKKRFPGQDIINVTGIRAEESSSRAKSPISQINNKLQRKDADGITWNAIIHYRLGDVFNTIAAAGLEAARGPTRATG